jgi:hypothetical protein
MFEPAPAPVQLESYVAATLWLAAAARQTWAENGCANAFDDAG